MIGKQLKRWSLLIALVLLTFVFVACNSSNQTASQIPEKVTLNEKPDEAAKILSEIDGGKVSPQQYKKWLTNKAVAYGIEPRAFLKYGALMHEIGMLNKEPKSIDELILPPLKGAGGD